MAKAWMPLYIGDYLADTTHLTQAQHGAYLLLIMHYWVRGALPSVHKQCMSIAKATTPEEQQAVEQVLKEFFVQQGASYVHARIEKELASAGEAYARRRAAAEKRWGKAAAPPAPAKKVQSQPQSQSAVVKEKPKKGEPKDDRQTDRGDAARYSEKAHGPSGEQLAWAREFTRWDDGHLEDVRGSYTEYWASSKGQKVKRTAEGWDRTWRTWVRAECRRTGYGGGNRAGGSDARKPASEAHASRLAGWGAALSQRRVGTDVSGGANGAGGPGENRGPGDAET